MSKNPLCFILMPFGKKTVGELSVNFDEIYNQVIKPAAYKAELEPIRADEEITDGIIHKPMFERLILCDYAIADLTGANANVFYELGVRHAIKPYSTVLIFADSTRLPFDVSFLRALPYAVDQNGKVINAERSVEQLTNKLMAAKKNKANDSPLYQLLDNYPNVAHEKTDVFREFVEYSQVLKKQLNEIRNSEQPEEEKLKSFQAFETGLKDLNDVESGVIVDLFLSYRSVEAFKEMISLFEKMPKPLKATVLVREQYAFALNRNKKRQDAIDILELLIKERGASSETYGLLGRIYKDQWSNAIADNPIPAKAFLRKAISFYTLGFEADWRDAYPGINACTLLYIENSEQEELKKMLPVVRYAVTKKIQKQGADYWDQATLFELDTLESSKESAEKNLEEASILIREKWEAATTLNNLQMIRKAMEKKGDEAGWIIDFEKVLEGIISAFP